MMHWLRFALSCLVFLVLVPIGFARSLTAAEPTQRDVTFAVVGEHELKLDFYRPDNMRNKRSPIIVWVHGGAWRKGSKESMPIGHLRERGFAIASVNYRLSPKAKFPAQVHDIKAAIRFLRANADAYEIHPEKFVVAGASAGGHLAALVGVTNGVEELEGDVGDHLVQSSDVEGIVSFYGASNLTSILSQSTPHGLSVREPALKLLLGGLPDKQVQLARLASPVFHVDEHDPPLVLIHGDQDPQMPINQSHELVGAYRRAGLKVKFHVVYGAAHGGPEFYREALLDELAESLRERLAR